MISYKPDLSSPYLIEETFSEFISAKSTYYHYFIIALSSNRDNKEKNNKNNKDNKGNYCS